MSEKTFNLVAFRGHYDIANTHAKKMFKEFEDLLDELNKKNKAYEVSVQKIQKLEKDLETANKRIEEYIRLVDTLD